MPFKKITKAGTPDLHGIIKTQITKSGMKVSEGFFESLDGYVQYHKFKGKEAETVKVYLAQAAMKIAQKKTGRFQFGEKANLLKPSDVKAAAYLFHRPVSMDDPCRRSYPQIRALEKARTKGSQGQLLPAFSKLLDRHKI